jgi:hypothetical protein
MKALSIVYVKKTNDFLRKNVGDRMQHALVEVLGFSFLFFAEVRCPFELARVSSKL